MDVGYQTLLSKRLNLISSNQETDMYSNNLTGKSFRNSINFQNGPTKLIPNEQRYHGQRYSQDMSSYDNSGLIYSAHPGGVQLSNHNENFNPYSKGVCTKQAPYLQIKPKYKSNGRDKMKTLVLDIDETLVHSSFKPIENPDIIISVGKDKIYVMFRPGAQEFIQYMSKFYELIVFTASMDRYAFPLMEQLDQHHLCEYVLCREYCTQIDGAFVKDLSKMGRNLEDTIILDNSPNSYFLQRNNGLPILSWYDDPYDRELYKYIEILEVLAEVPDVTLYIPKICYGDKIDYNRAHKMIQDLKPDIYSHDLKKYKSEKNLYSPFEKATNELSSDVNYYSYGHTFDLKSSNQPKHKGMPSESRDVSYYKAKDAFTIDMKDQISKCYTPISNKSREGSKTKIQEKVDEKCTHNRLIDAAYKRKLNYESEEIKSQTKSSSRNTKKKSIHKPKTSKNSSRSISYKPVKNEKENQKQAKDWSYKEIDKSSHYQNVLKEAQNIKINNSKYDYSTYNSYKNSMKYENICVSNVRNESVQRKVEKLKSNNYDVESTTKILSNFLLSKIYNLKLSLSKIRFSKEFYSISKRLSSAFENDPTSYISNQKTIKPQKPISSKVECQRGPYKGTKIQESSTQRRKGEISRTDYDYYLKCRR